MEQNKATLAPILSRFVMVTVEETHFEHINGNDFLGFEVSWFPSFMIYNPTNQRWTALSSGNANALAAKLDIYLNNSSFSDYYTNQILGNLRAGTPVNLEDLLNALIPLSTEADAGKYLATLTEISSFMEANPALFLETVDDIRLYLTMAHSRLIERGIATLADIRTADPKAFPGLEQDLRKLNSYAFAVPIGTLIRTQGNKAASDQCQALADAAVVATSAATPEQQRVLTVSRDLQCLLLEIQLQQKTGADARAYLATLSEEEKLQQSASLMKVFGATGTDFDLAIEYGTIWQAGNLNSLAKYPEVLARVQAATDARLNAYRANRSHP